jgi:hypothetical protein
LRAMTSRCQRKIAAGVTGKTSGHRRWLTSHDSAASQSGENASGGSSLAGNPVRG